MKHTKRLTFFVFILLTLTSPFLYPLLLNPSNLNLSHFSRDPVEREILADRINVLRGETNNVLPEAFNRVVVNRFTVSFRYYLENYGKSTDPGFLFFTGREDLSQYVVQTGALLVSVLLFAIVGLAKAISNFKKYLVVLMLLAMSPMLSAYLGKPFNSVLLLPFFAMILFFAANGFVVLYKNKKLIFYLIAIYFVFEVVAFYHTFFNHYLILLA